MVVESSSSMEEEEEEDLEEIQLAENDMRATPIPRKRRGLPKGKQDRILCHYV